MVLLRLLAFDLWLFLTLCCIRHKKTSLSLICQLRIAAYVNFLIFFINIQNHFFNFEVGADQRQRKKNSNYKGASPIDSTKGRKICAAEYIDSLAKLVP